MIHPQHPFKFTPYDRPERGDYYVCRVEDVQSVSVAYITVYDDGRRTYEFDNEILYSHEDLEQLLVWKPEVK